MKRLLLIVLFALAPLQSWAAGCAGTGSCYWILGTGNTVSTTKWSTTSGNSFPGVGVTGSVPTAADDCIFDSLSSATAYTVTVNNALACKNIIFSAPLTSGNVTFAGASAMTVAGNVTMYAGLIRTYSGVITMQSTGVVTSAGAAIGAEGLTVSGSGISVTLADAYATTGTITLTQGTFDASGFTVAAKILSSSNTNTRTLTRGSGAWSITGNAATVWQMTTATNLALGAQSGLLSFTYSGGTGTRTLTFPAGLDVGNVAISAGSDIVTMGGIVSSLNFTGFTGTWTGSGAITSTGNVTLAAGMAAPTYSGILTFGAASGTQTLTSNGVSVAFAPKVNNAGTTFSNADALVTSGACTMSAGVWNLGAAVTCGGLFSHLGGTLTTAGFAVSSGSVSGSGTRTITCTSTWTVSGSGTAWSMSATGLTATLTGCTVKLTNASVTFSSGAQSYGTVWFAAATPVITFTNGGTIGTLLIDGGDATLTLPPVATTTSLTVTTPTISGTSGHLTTITSSGATNATLATGAGAQTLDYISASKLTCTGGGQWNLGTHSVDGGNNGGCVFPLTTNKPLAIAGN